MTTDVIFSYLRIYYDWGLIVYRLGANRPETGANPLWNEFPLCCLATASGSAGDHRQKKKQNRKMVEKASVLSWRGSDQYYNPYIGRGEVLFTGKLVAKIVLLIT